MAKTRKAYLPARIDPAALRELDRHAKRLGKPRSNLVERYVEEWLRMDKHPGIVFVEGAAGRRPALASRRGLDVWEVITTLHANDGKVADAAEVLSLPESEVHLALTNGSERTTSCLSRRRPPRSGKQGPRAVETAAR